MVFGCIKIGHNLVKKQRMNNVYNILPYEQIKKRSVLS